MRNLACFSGGRIRRRSEKRAMARQTRVSGPREAGQEGVHCVRRRRPLYKPQAQSRGDRRETQKGPFMDGYYLAMQP